MIVRYRLNPTIFAGFWAIMSAPIATGDDLRPEMLDTHVRPFLETYCLDCHTGADAERGVDLSVLPEPDRFIREKKRWQKVVGQMRGKGMPPHDSEQPPDEERAMIADWLDVAAHHFDCGQPTTPGRPTLRRLNRIEYDRTIHDLVGIDFNPGLAFPADDVGEGFDNIGDVLSISPILIEKYLGAAQEIARRAIVVPERFEPVVERWEGEASRSTAGGGTTDEGKAQRLAKAGELYRTVRIPATGEYVFRVRAYGEQAGPEPVRGQWKFGDKTIDPFDIAATANEPVVYEHVESLTKGKHRVAIAFVNDFFESSTGEDRNLVVDYWEIEGPVSTPKPELTESHQRLVFRPLDGPDRDEALSAILDRLASRAFRRPARAEEVQRLVGLCQLAVEKGEPIEVGLQLALQAVLVSPHFLFRIEEDGDDVRTLTGHELATRLSYFLWSTMPDDALFEHASSGALLDERVFHSEVDRMLADDQSEAFVKNFAGQWLQLRNLDIRQPNPGTFPNFDERLRADMRRESELFFQAILKDRRGIEEFLSANYTFANERLAKHYGIPDVKGDEFRRVDTTDFPRGGILTQASILTITSDPTRTSPVKRGKWVMETLLGSPPPDPPANVPLLEQQKQLTGTLRERMEQHRENPACATCHAEMDPLGFGLENFDGVGAWRTQDGETAIDASGQLPDGSSFRGPRELADRLILQKRQFTRNLAEKMLTYALGRGLEYYDTCVVDDIVAQVEADQYRLATMVHAIVQSRPFRMSGPREPMGD